MLSFKRLLLLACLPLGLGACATHQLRFDPWAGVPADQAAELERGEFRVEPDALFDAAATTLEHEPYLHWSIQDLRKGEGFIRAEAGVLREVQLRVSAVKDAKPVLSRLSVNVPRRELKTRAKIWIRDDGFQTAYEPAAAEIGRYKVLSADAVLDGAYLRSFAYRALNDHSQVPFKLQAYDGDKPLALPVETPVPVDQAPLDASPIQRAEPAGDPSLLPRPQPEALEPR
jgi:hypothetical protein